MDFCALAMRRLVGAVRGAPVSVLASTVLAARAFSAERRIGIVPAAAR
jgi:hypothetical protein